MITSTISTLLIAEHRTSHMQL